MLFIDNQVNSEDYENPITPFLNSKLIPITTSLFKNYFLKFSDLRYKSDNNLFFSSYEETQSYKMTEITESVDLRGDNTLIKGTFNQINFIMADETKIITRLYDKISYSFAQIGGLTHIFILFSKIILYFWSENNVLIYLISTILSDNEKNKFFAKDNKDIDHEILPRTRTFLFHKNDNKGKRKKNEKVKEKEKEKINLNNNKDNKNNIINDNIINISNNANKNLINSENINENSFSNNNLIIKENKLIFINNSNNNNNNSNQNDLNSENIIPNIAKIGKNNNKKNYHKQINSRIIAENNLKKEEDVPENIQEIIQEKIVKNSKQEINKNLQVENPGFGFNFFNKLCIRALLPKKKRSFLNISKEIIDSKLSMENILEMTIKLQIINNYLFNQGQNNPLEKLPEFNLEDHLNENYNVL